MTYFLEVNSQGGLYVSPELLSKAVKSDRYILEIEGGAIVLRPVTSVPLWQRTPPTARVRQWQSWATKHQVRAKALPDEALHRDNIYD